MLAGSHAKRKIDQKLATLKGDRGIEGIEGEGGGKKCVHFEVLSQYFWPGL